MLTCTRRRTYMFRCTILSVTNDLIRMEFLTGRGTRSESWTCWPVQLATCVSNLFSCLCKDPEATSLGTHRIVLESWYLSHFYCSCHSWHGLEAAHNLSTPDLLHVERETWFRKCQVMGCPSPSCTFLPRRSCPGSPDVSVSPARRSIATQVRPVRRPTTGCTFGGSFE